MENIFDTNLDITSVDDSTLEELDLNDYGTLDVEIKEPHLKLSTKEFSEALKIAKSTISSNSKDLISRSALLKLERGVLYLYCTDFDVYLKLKLNILNTENLLTDTVIFPVDSIMQLLKAVPSTTIITKKDNDYFINLVGGSVILETHVVDESKFMFSDKMNLSDKTINSNTLYNIIKDFSPLVTSAISPSEKRIVFSNRVISTYMLSSISADLDLPDLDLRVKDMSILKQLTNLEKEEELNLLFGENGRVAIEGSTFKYIFLTSDLKTNKTLLEILDKQDYKSGLYIDYLSFYKLIELSAELSYSTGKVNIKLEDDKCDVTFKTRKGNNSILKLEGLKEGNVTSIEKEVQSKLLRILLKSFTGNAQVKINLTEEALIITSDTYKGVLFIN